MRDGWQEVALGDVATFQNGYPFKPADLGDTGLPVIRIKQLLNESSEPDKSTIDVPGPQRINFGDVVFSWSATLAVTIWTRGESLLNQHLFTVNPKSGAVLKPFLAPLLDFLIPNLPLHGTTMKHVTKKDLTAYMVLMPPLAEQQRIVDLIGSLDEAIEAADASHDAQLGTLSNSLDAEVPGETIALGDLATIKSGASWAAADGSNRPSVGARPVLTIVNTRPNGSIDLTERTYVLGLTKSAATITDDSLVMIRTNGNRSRIGNVYRSTTEIIGDSVSAFQFVLEPAPAANRDFLYWSLRAPSRQGQISEAASGSTGLGNVAAGWLRTLELPWPVSSERERLVALWESFGDAVDAASQYAASLRNLRTNLLTALLSGTHEIPESYDDLPPEAA